MFDRENFAAYIDLEADVTDDFLLGVAVRFEDFSDFGTTTNGKLAARFQIADAFAIRGAASTGFRAPTTGQSNVRNVSTGFTAGVLADEATLPPTHPISVQKGGVPLQPEESVNLTVGAVLAIGNLELTIDYFNIEVTDRISLAPKQILSPADIAALLALGQADASSFTAVRFFTNAFDTTTQGIDLVATLPVGDNTELTFSGNWTDTKVDKFDPAIISPDRISAVEGSIPETRFVLTGTHQQDDWSALLRVNYFGEYFEPYLGELSLPIDAGAEVTVDAEIGYTFNDSLTIVLGAQNLLDEEPDLNPWFSILGSKFPLVAPMDDNGAFYYVRATWDVF